MMKLTRYVVTSCALLAALMLGGTACSGSDRDAGQSGLDGIAGASVRGDSGGTRAELGGSPSAQGGASERAGIVAGGTSGGALSGGGSQLVGGSAGSANQVDKGSSGASMGGTSQGAGGNAAGGRKAVGGSSSSGGNDGGTASSTGGAVAVGGNGSGGSRASGGAATGGRSSDSAGSAGSYPVSTGRPTVYLAGDSTVQTYAASSTGQQGWGQRLQEFFTSTNDVVVVNKAIGGRSSKSFIDEGRLSEIIALLKRGDYLFAQWGINDRYSSDAARYTNPATTFRTYLKQYIDGARSKNAIPVLVTPTPRHQYVNGVFENAFPAYCEAIKAVGLETKTPVIDLQSEALAYYTGVGDAYVTSTIMLDVLHFKTRGAYEMARLVAQGIVEIDVPVSRFIVQSKL